MPQSKVEVYLHYVWATRLRIPMITPQVERAIHRSIQSQVQNLGCVVISVNGTDDHVHLLVKIAPTVDIARLANQVKGASSFLVKQEFPEMTGFSWQDGYAAFSVTPNQVERVSSYVHNQKQHHNDGTTFNRWEPDLSTP